MVVAETRARATKQQLLQQLPLQGRQPLLQLLLHQPQAALQLPLLLHLLESRLLLQLLLLHLVMLLRLLPQLRQLASQLQLLLQLHPQAQEEEEARAPEDPPLLGPPHLAESKAKYRRSPAMKHDMTCKSGLKWLQSENVGPGVA